MLSEENRIDIIARAPDGRIVLAISAHEDWNTAPHTLEQLDRKLKTYVRFVESGQCAQEYGHAPITIEIMTAYPLSPQAASLVEKVEMACGIEIRVHVM